MKRIMIMAAMLVGISVAALTFSSCSSDDNESPVSGELVSDVVPSNEGLKGTPNEMKIKYIADNQFKDIRGQELTDKIIKTLEDTDMDTANKELSEGTTPRQISDLVASLCDLTSGSGDKGTPVVLVQGYFDNYSSK